MINRLLKSNCKHTAQAEMFYIRQYYYVFSGIKRKIPFKILI
jgi:hypothetical protein